MGLAGLQFSLPSSSSVSLLEPDDSYALQPLADEHSALIFVVVVCGAETGRSRWLGTIPSEVLH